MSLQAFDVVPLKEQMMEKWDEDQRPTIGARCLKVLRFTKEQQVYCVWWQWPYNEFDTSGTSPVIYLPGRIIDVCIKNKRGGTQVTCINIEHEFTPEGATKNRAILKLELDQCLFIAKHSWTSETMLKVRQAANEVLTRYNAIKNKDITLGGAMRKVALDMHTNHLGRSQSSAATASTAPKQAIAYTATAPNAWLTSRPSASTSHNVSSVSQARQVRSNLAGAATVTSTKRAFDYLEEDLTNFNTGGSPSYKYPRLSSQRPSTSVAESWPIATDDETDVWMPNSTLKVLKDGVATSLQTIGRSIVQTHSLDAQIRNTKGDSSALHLQMTGLLQELNHLREDLKKVSKGLADLY